MNPQRARLVEELFAEALRRAPADRESFLLGRCAGDDGLLSELRTLLECAAVDDGVLDGSAPALLNIPRQTEDPAHLAPGARIGPYTIRSVLGVGGMGVVYLGEQARPQRTVALKVIRPGFATPTVLKRFEHEAEVLGRLQHPGIAQIIEAGAAETPLGVQPFFAMELVDGRPLTEHARQRSLSRRQRVELMVLVCDAVEHAHQRGVVHRDLKPANILVTPAGQPKVLDFGVARAIGGREAEQRLTLMRTGERQLVGTLAYMSPEQVAGDPSAIDTRSDVYSLGVILFELLSGHLPHDLHNRPLPDAVRVIRDEDPRTLGTLDPACRGDLEIICAKALEREPADRYSTAAQLAEDLRRFLRDAPIEARPRSALYHLAKFARRNRGLVAGAALAVIALLVGAVISVVQYREAIIARGEAEARATEADTQRQAAGVERDAKMKESENLRRTLKFIQDSVLTDAYMIDGNMGRAVSIVDALRGSEPWMARGLAGDPLSEARLRFYSALILQSNNEFEAALKAITRGAELFASLGGEASAERYEADLLRAGLLARLGRFAQADRLTSDVIARDGEGPRTNTCAIAGYMLMEQGSFANAEPFMRRQFELALASTGITPLNTNVQARRYGQLLVAMERYDDAQALWDERIGACAAHFGGGDTHPITIAFLAAAADQFEQSGQDARARPYLRRALAGASPDLWVQRPFDVSIRLTKNLRRSPDGLAEAVEIARGSFEHARARERPRAPIVHQVAAEYIRCLIAAGRTADARLFADQAMALYHSETGEWRYRVSDVRQSAAEALLADGDAAAAAALARAELDRRARLRGWPDPTTWESLRTLGAALTRLGRSPEVVTLCNAALAEQLETDTVTSAATLAALPAIAETMLDSGQARAAADMIGRLLAEPLTDPGTIRRPIIELRCLQTRATLALESKDAALGQIRALEREASGILGTGHPWLRRISAESQRITAAR